MYSFKYGIFYGRLWGRRKIIKEKLVREYGKCYWCGIKVKIHVEIKGITPPFDTATLDHLKSKNLGRKKGENTPKVLSCKKCNEDRALEEIKLIKKDAN